MFNTNLLPNSPNFNPIEKLWTHLNFRKKICKINKILDLKIVLLKFVDELCIYKH